VLVVHYSRRPLILLFNEEYPGTERGGAENDGQNFLSLLKEFETAIDKAGRPTIISITTPASYW
jgi:GH18 family chitinase